MLTQPIFIYDNWTAYDELADTIPLTEALAIRELDELLRLRALGVRFDYYLVDAFWYDPDGGYRLWRKEGWSDGPERFLERCLENEVRPGLWIGGNNLCGMNPIAAWKDSLAEKTSANPVFRGSLCMFYGGFLPDLLDALRGWYARGVRLFKFDFLNMHAAPPALQRAMLPSEIRRANEQALIAGLKGLRADCPGIVLTGYNGFDEAETQTNTTLPFRKTIGSHWLEAFDSMYCGDPRPADTPCMDFWRANDIYSDHMARVYEQNGYPLQRIDNCAFMIGVSGSCYGRKTAAWQGMLLLSLARGGWVNSYHGNLELLDDAQGLWFAQAQGLFYPFQRNGRIMSFGGVPGEQQPYGWLAGDVQGCLVTAVNPSQAVACLPLPEEALRWEGGSGGRVLFRDAGFEAGFTQGCLALGPEQMALVGFGRYASAEFDLGVQQDVVIPSAIQPLEARFIPDGPHAVHAEVFAPASRRLRLVLRQLDDRGRAKRISGREIPGSDSTPNGPSLGSILRLSARQGDRHVPIRIGYDHPVWSGLSWAVGEIDADSLDPGHPVEIRMESDDPTARLAGRLYWVEYA